MQRSPFLDDPCDQFAKHIASAVESPIEAVRATHIKLAEHFAEMAKASGLPLRRTLDQAGSTDSSASTGS
jgi:hypothetical protein